MRVVKWQKKQKELYAVEIWFLYISSVRKAILTGRLLLSKKKNWIQFQNQNQKNVKLCMFLVNLQILKRRSEKWR